jgi:hypothetical protein
MALEATWEGNTNDSTYHNAFSILEFPVRKIESQILERRKLDVESSIRVFVFRKKRCPCTKKLTSLRIMDCRVIL